MSLVAVSSNEREFHGIKYKSYWWGFTIFISHSQLEGYHKGANMTVGGLGVAAAFPGPHTPVCGK